MAPNAHNTILSASVCAIVFGFFTAESSNKIIRKLINAYCISVTVVQPLFLIVFSAISVLNDQLRYLGSVYLILDAVTIVTLTHYRLGFVAGRNIAKSVLDSLSYVGQCLTSLGVEVQHRRERLTCAAYVILAGSLHASNAGIILYNMRTFTNLQNLNIHYSLSFYSLLSKLSHYFSDAVFESYVIVILYVMKRRLTLYHKAISSFLKLRRRRTTAWPDHGTVSSLQAACVRSQQLSHVYTVYNCIIESYHNVKKFYHNFFVFELLSTIFMASLYFLSALNQCDMFLFVVSIVTMLVIKTIFLCLAVSIDYEFQRTQGIINEAYYENGLQQSTKTFKRWNFLLSHRNLAFDCEFSLWDSL